MLLKPLMERNQTMMDAPSPDQTPDLTMTVSRVIPASQTRVYDAWLDPAMLARFMVAKDGASVPEAQADPRVGGKYLIVMRHGDQDLPHHGTYLELVPHSRIVFSWQSAHSIDGSVVTLTFTPEDGGTRVDLRQDRFASEGAREGHRGGWTRILQELTATV